MRISFKNKSKDLCVELALAHKGAFSVLPELHESVEINEDSVTFSVKYVRDFTFGYQFASKSTGKISDRITDKLTEKAVDSVGNAIVQIVNTYRISGLKDGSVIEVNDRAHYLSVDGIYGFFGCFPALYYFGQAECETAKIEIVSSHSVNRTEFLRLYRFIYGTINLHGFIFNIVKYKIQVSRQKKISASDYITRKFKELYSLPLSEREYQFKPITVLTDKFLNFIKGKLPKRIYNKLVRKLKKYFNI